MARAKTHSVDAVLSEVRIILTAGGGIQLVVHYTEQERDETGVMVRQETERREALDPADMSPAQRATLEPLLRNVLAAWRRRKEYD